jgi:hypothetical protein
VTSHLMPESQALQIHLFGTARNRYTTSFVAALEDARGASGRDITTGAVIDEPRTGHWLGAVGYLILLDQIGTCFKPKSAARLNGAAPIICCLRYWARGTSNRESEAIYGLRNALAHDYSVFNPAAKVPQLYRLDRQVGRGVVRFGKRTWDGKYDKISRDSETLVSLRELSELSERIVSEVRSACNSSAIEILLNGGSDELLVRYGVYFS